MMMLIPLCFTLLAYLTNAETLKSEPIVKLRQGTLDGFRFKYPDESGRAANIFLGVPYAKPPVGIRRFEKPEPLEESDVKMVRLIVVRQFSPFRKLDNSRQDA